MKIYSFKQMCSIISNCYCAHELDQVALYIFENLEAYREKYGIFIMASFNLVFDMQRRKAKIEL